MVKWPIFTSSLPGVDDPGIPIAGSRAGAIGVLDFQYSCDLAAIETRLDLISRFTTHDFGIRLSSDQTPFLKALLPRIPSQAVWVILAGAAERTLKSGVRLFQERGCKVLVEAVSIAEAIRAEKAGARGVVAKGHEAGGRIGEETTFILLQRFLRDLRLPVYAHGGIGLHTAAACYAAGAAGIVLDSQLALARESTIPKALRSRIAGLDGTETVCLGEEVGATYRMCSRLGGRAVKKLQEMLKSIVADPTSAEEKALAWRRAVSDRVGRDSEVDRVFLLGQDIAFAGYLAERFVTVGGIVDAIRREVENHLAAARRRDIAAEGSALALSHGTRFPIVQGPMARVSDTPRFALEVARHGALPFLAAAWLSGQELERLLQETQRLIEPHPWGVGLLGFLPPDVYKEQLKSILAHRPPFALIAGGQPGQYRALEAEGIATYLHVPSPGLLKMFLDAGVKRFVLEGRESGGHVGPLCSFTLWDQMVDVLLQHGSGGLRMADYHVLFAGGIHDALSASMVAALSAPLAEREVRVGFQLGSAYLFTEEAVQTGAIVGRYREEAIRCKGTTVIVTGPGDEERCIDSCFAKSFKREKRRLNAGGASFEEMRQALQLLKRGKLRIAAKGLERNPEHREDVPARKIRPATEDEQTDQGLYLVGQLAGLRGDATDIQRLHQAVSNQASELIAAFPEKQDRSEIRGLAATPSDVAVIGMACLFPKAASLQAFWENILNRVNAIREIPEDRWDWRSFFDADKTARDKIYSRWGAFLEDVPFDPVQYGMPPNSLSSIEPLQLLTLEVTKQAMEDAGYLKRPFLRERTSVILGISGTGDLAQLYGFRTTLPTFFGEGATRLVSNFEGFLPEWTEDSFPGILTNVTAGRIANRFDFGGTNFTVDAACASSLAAVYLAVRELESHQNDMVIVGGADCMQNPFTYMGFAKTQALSAKGQCAPLAEHADGILLGEGIAVLVLKRLADAERDGDRIYAVIKGVGASSDGKGMSLTAPSQEGQVLSLRRAYQKAGASPASVELIEAHATGTVVGDRTEIDSLIQVFKEAGAPEASCAIGSLKSMIGHTKSTAGVASMMKAILALHHQVLPPTLGVETPNPGLCRPGNPLYVSTDTRPWFVQSPEQPRRAGVSAFGFGGTNFHAVLEEYSGDYLAHLKNASFQAWPSELFICNGRSRSEVLARAGELQEILTSGAKTTLADLSHAHACRNREYGFGSSGNQLALAIVASSLEDLAKKLQLAGGFLRGTGSDLNDPGGVYFTETPLASEGKIAFLFPGQGSQYVNMLADLAIQFPEVRSCFERSDRLLQERFPRPLTSYIFPISAFGDEQQKIRRQALDQTHIAQPAMGTADLAMLRLMKSFGIKPDMVAGHSYGEYVALCAAGVLSEEDLIAISEARARCIRDSVVGDTGVMAAVQAEAAVVETAIEGVEGVWVANVNAPLQTIIAGTQPGIETAVTGLNRRGIQTRPIAVSCAFHSPIIAPAAERLAVLLSEIRLGKPRIHVFSNLNAGPYPTAPRAIAKQLVQHLTHRVEFVQQIEAMYEAGARLFVEVGPGRVLSGLVDQILGERPHRSVITNQAGRSGLVQLLHLLGQAAVQGAPVHLNGIFTGRTSPDETLTSPLSPANKTGLAPTTWLVNGTRAIPISKAAEAAAGRGKAPGPFQILPEPMVSPCDDGRQERISSNTPSRGAASGAPSPTVTNNTRHFLKESRSPAGSSKGEVMIQYQRMMQHFLETQKNVMMAFLQQGTWPADHPVPDAANYAPLAAPSMPAGQPADSGQSRLSPMPEAPIEEKGAAAIPKGMTRAAAMGVRVTEAEESGAPSDRFGCLRRGLIKVVSDRTGYPEEMLNLDFDIEAELGIDSIKRVEIMSSFAKGLTEREQANLQPVMGELSRLKTLRAVLEKAAALAGVHSANASADAQVCEPDLAGRESVQSVGDGKELVPRFVIDTAINPHSGSPQQLPRGGTFIVTDDRRGLSAHIADAVRKNGCRAVVLRNRTGSVGSASDEDGYSVDFSDAASLNEAIASIAGRYGPIAGLLHLAALDSSGPPDRSSLSAWRDHLKADTKTLLFLAQSLSDNLRDAGKRGKAWLLAATALAENSNPHPESSLGQAGMAGFIKTLAKEWPDVDCRIVHLDLVNPVPVLADQVLGELLASEGNIETAYPGTRRVVSVARLSSLDRTAQERISVKQDWVILVTGGAAGITAGISRMMAERYRPILILAGRSPFPEWQEPADTVGLSGEKELKTTIFNQMKSSGDAPTPAAVDRVWAHLMKEREIRENVDQMRKAGATVRYFQADVRDENVFGGLVDEIYRTYGRLDGVIHGAGVIEDKLVEAKSAESFDRVFDTKVASAFVLSRKLKPESLKFIVFFTSVAGFYGNRGQADYAAANEVLNELSRYLDERWPGRVVAVNWGPWKRIGMVTPEMERQFREKGIQLIPLDAGVRLLDEEIRFGKKGEVELVVGDGPWRT